MSKIKRKVNLISLTDFCAYESWLSDMAGKGLILKKAGRLYNRFTVSEPREMEYRIQFIGNPVSEETRSKYQKSGWTYVNTISEYSIFCHDTKQNTSPAEEEIIQSGMNFNYVTRNFTMTYATMAVLAITLFWFLYVSILSSPFPLLNTISSLLSLLFLLTGAATMITYSLKNTFEFRKLRQAFLEGRKFNHHMPWRQYHRTACAVLLVLTSMLLINIGADLYGSRHTFRYYNEKPPVTATEEVPLLHLSDIESKSSDSAEGFDTLFFLKKPSIFYTEYVLSESHPVESDPNSTGAAVGSSFLEEVTINLGPKFLAKPILKEFVRNTIYNYEQIPNAKGTVNLITLEVPEFDEAYYIYKENSLDLFARKGHVVVKLRYLGSKGIEDILPLLKEQLGK